MAILFNSESITALILGTLFLFDKFGWYLKGNPMGANLDENIDKNWSLPEPSHNWTRICWFSFLHSIIVALTHFRANPQ